MVRAAVRGVLKVFLLKMSGGFEEVVAISLSRVRGLHDKLFYDP